MHVCPLDSAHHRRQFWKAKQHKMKELSIPSEFMNLVLKMSVSAPIHIAVKYLHFALASMETEYLSHSKPYLNYSAVIL